MSKPTASRKLFISLLGVLVLAMQADAQRPGGGGGGGGRPSGGTSAGGGGRPSSSGGGASRPSAPSVSRASAPSMSRPSAASSSRPSPSYQRGSPSPSPSPRAEAPAPRYEAPAPRYEAPAPRYEQPTAPRYEQPRYEAPSAPRYDAPSGRIADDGGSADAPARGGPSSGRLDAGGRGSSARYDDGRIGPAPIDRGAPTPYTPRVWQPAPIVELSGAVRPPRVGVPSISGSRSAPDGGLAAGRLEKAGLTGARANAAVPHPSVDGNALRARYGASDSGASAGRVPSADAAARSRDASARSAAPTSRGSTGSGRGLSGERTRGETRAAVPGATTIGDAGSRSREQARRTIDGQPAGGGRDGARGGNDTNRRVAAGMQRAAETERTNPDVGRRLRAAGEAGAAAGSIVTGIVVGTGSCGWDPCGDAWDNCGWYWNSCWYGGWWWGWGCGWPYGCRWGWPYYGSCWGYGYSSYGWCYSPWVYTTVVYEDYYDQPQAVVVEEPAPAAAPAPEAGVPAQGAVPKAPPEVRAGLEASADEALQAGDAAFREGRFSDAVRHYARAVEFSPERGSLWLILSDALFATGDYHYAAYAFRRAVELDATLLETLVDKHGWYANPAEFDRHIAWAEAYLRDHVLDEDARLILSANYLFAKRFASASDVLESAFGAGLLDTPAGKLVLERSRRALGMAPR